MVHSPGSRIVCNVIKEGTACTVCTGCLRRSISSAAYKAFGCNKLCVTVSTWDEVAVKVCNHQRYTQHIHIRQLNPQHLARLVFDVCPSGRPTVLALQHVTSSDCLHHPIHFQAHILSQENLVRLVRGIDLVQVNKWRGLIDVLPYIICSPKNAIRTRGVGSTR